jgi:hypothetical protein
LTVSLRFRYEFADFFYRGGSMESDLNYFRRRAAAEALAARRSVTPEAKARHTELAETYSARLRDGESHCAGSIKEVAAA